MTTHAHAPGDYLWTLNGYDFGCGTPVRVLSWEPGTATWRRQRHERAHGHGDLVGRDWHAPRLWSFTLEATGGAGADRLDIAEALTTAWAAADRRGPGQLSVLSYGLPGRRRRVYGRPADITPVEVWDALHGPGWRFVADFELVDPVVYSDDADTLTLELAAPATGGATWPMVWPTTWNRSTTARAGIVRVDGTAEVPFTIEVRGPVSGVASDLHLSGPGWQIDLDVSVAYDQTVLIDTRAMTATRNGASVAGALSRRSRLSARLRPGDQEIHFTANDPTNTARATVTWRSGWRSL